MCIVFNGKVGATIVDIAFLFLSSTNAYQFTMCHYTFLLLVVVHLLCQQSAPTKTVNPRQKNFWKQTEVM